jgi:hypothetical protein
LLDESQKFFQLPSKTIQSGKLVTGICNEVPATWSKPAIQYPLKPCPLKLALAARDSVFGLLAGIDIEDFEKLPLSEQLKLYNSIIKLTDTDHDRYFQGYNDEFRKFVGIELKTSLWRPFVDLIYSYHVDDSKDQELATLHDRLLGLTKSIVQVVQQISEIGKFEFPFSEEAIHSMPLSRFSIMITMLGLDLEEEFEQIPKLLGLSDSQSRYCFDRMTLNDLLWFLEIAKHPLKEQTTYGYVQVLRPQVKDIFTLIFDKTSQTLTQFTRHSAEQSEQILRYMIANDFISHSDSYLDGETVLQRACLRNYNGKGRDLIELCVKKGAKLSDPWDRVEGELTPLELTIFNRCDWKQLIDMGARTCYYGKDTIIDWFVKNQHIWKKVTKASYQDYLHPDLFKELWEKMHESLRGPAPLKCLNI